MSDVRIYQLDGPFAIWVWLCGKHVEARKAKGWVVKESRDPPHELMCDDCHPGNEQGSPF